MVSVELLVASFFAVLAPLAESVTKLSEEECVRLGFRRPQCMHCEELDNFNLSSLKKSCLNCCETDASNETVKSYSRSLSMKIRALSSDTSNRMDKFPNFSVRYVRGADPLIKLFDDEDDVVEMSIQKWDTDTVEEFLKEHLL
ncbi:15 kDa selenoprotein-like protein [Leptotrombidium deliense]|uniref:Selenoprotein F n=1 Tax=Leptotrombidium deliense TaxID=299467 RepID=A0A443SJM3_9ACAR|nr:15 kDa selenoprotein-like protein [Leptotrombidium deliense]